MVLLYAKVDQINNRAVSYGEALRQSLKLVHSLQQFGVTSKDVITIVSENNIDYYLPVFAGLMIGAAVNPLNPTYTASEFKLIFGACKYFTEGSI